MKGAGEAGLEPDPENSRISEQKGLQEQNQKNGSGDRTRDGETVKKDGCQQQGKGQEDADEIRGDHGADEITGFSLKNLAAQRAPRVHAVNAAEDRSPETVRTLVPEESQHDQPKTSPQECSKRSHSVFTDPVKPMLRRRRPGERFICRCSSSGISLEVLTEGQLIRVREKPSDTA